MGTLDSSDSSLSHEGNGRAARLELKARERAESELSGAKCAFWRCGHLPVHVEVTSASRPVCRRGAGMGEAHRHTGIPSST